jgi:hypothetical protein
MPVQLMRVRQCLQWFWCLRNCVQTLCQRQLQQRPPFGFGQGGKFIHYSVSEWIGGPEKFHILLRPRTGNEVGGVEAGISRRDELLGFRHELWKPSGEDAPLSATAYIEVLLGPVTGVMSFADASGRTSCELTSDAPQQHNCGLL